MLGLSRVRVGLTHSFFVVREMTKHLFERRAGGCKQTLRAVTPLHALIANFSPDV